MRSRQSSRWLPVSQYEYEKRESHPIARLLLGSAAVFLTLVAIRSLPDVVRYLKMKSM